MGWTENNLSYIFLDEKPQAHDVVRGKVRWK